MVEHVWANRGTVTRVLALRLAGPLQAWSSSSQYNRRETDLLPTKSGVLRLLAAAQGRRRSDPIEDLLGLRLGIRVDQPGVLLRDYHTVSDLHHEPLWSASVNAKGIQKRTSPKKYTHVTERFYLQDACFVAALEGSDDLMQTLAEAVSHPAFPLFLGRRSCPPSRPPLIVNGDSLVWDSDIETVLQTIPWQGKPRYVVSLGRKIAPQELPITFDSLSGGDEVMDVPVSYEPMRRGVMRTRTVSTDWVTPPGLPESLRGTRVHDPLELLGGSQ